VSIGCCFGTSPELVRPERLDNRHNNSIWLTGRGNGGSFGGGIAWDNMRSKIYRLLVGSGLLAWCQLSSAAVVDDFGQGALTLTATNVTGQTVVQTGLSDADVLGGTRSVYVGSLIHATGVIDTSAHEFRFRSDSSFGYFTLTEGGTFPSSGMDLTADGSDAFTIAVTQLTFKPVRGIFDFAVEADGAWHTFNLLSALAGLNGAGVVKIPFASFGGVDMRHIQAVRLDVARFEPGSEIAIGSITTVPEPSALATCFGAWVALAFVRKVTGR